jgi:hypothetical protein
MLEISQLLLNQTAEWYIAVESVSTAVGAISTSIAALVGIVILYFTYQSVVATRKMVIEMQKQRELQEEPAVSIKIIPDAKEPHILNMIIKNTGGGPAYDVSVTFDPDIAYGDTTLNGLRMFNKMPLLDKGEIIEFFFASAIEYSESDKPKLTTAKIEYYKTPFIHTGNFAKPVIRIINIDIIERQDQMRIGKKDMDDLVDEIEELKHGLLIIAKQIEEHRNDK